MKVGELIEKLKMCNQDDMVEVSLLTDDNQFFGGIIDINEITPRSIGNVTLIADEGERHIRSK